MNIRMRGESAHEKIISAISNDRSKYSQCSCFETMSNIHNTLYGTTQGGLMVSPSLDFQGKTNQIFLRKELERLVDAKKMVTVTMSPNHYFTICPAGVGEVRLYQSMQIRVRGEQTDIYSAGDYIESTYRGTHSGKRSLNAVLIDLEHLADGNANWRQTAAVSLFGHQELGGEKIKIIADSVREKEWYMHSLHAKDMI